jgi:hypothetical protein
MVAGVAAAVGLASVLVLSLFCCCASDSDDVDLSEALAAGVQVEALVEASTELEAAVFEQRRRSTLVLFQQQQQQQTQTAAVADAAAAAAVTNTTTTTILPAAAVLAAEPRYGVMQCYLVGFWVFFVLKFFCFFSTIWLGFVGNQNFF